MQLSLPFRKPPMLDGWLYRFLFYSVAGRLDNWGDWLKELSDRIELWLGFDPTGD